MSPLPWRFAVLAAFALTLAGCAAGVDEDPVGFVAGDNLKPRDYPIHGIDVSKYQGDVDWNSVANSGVKFAWIKATEGGDHVDAKFQANWDAAKAVGIPRGAYHFVYWCRSPLEEVRWFEQNVPVEKDELPPVLDVESDSESKTCHKYLDPQQTVADIKLMLDEMERYFGKKPIIYTSVDFYQAILADGALSDYAMWVRSTKYHPSVKYGSRQWMIWQYQADGHIPGIKGEVDRNAFYGTPVQWQEFFGHAQVTATPIRDAATLIIVERAVGSWRVLMGKRHAGHKFMPGKFVFPGGAVDPGDGLMAIGAPLDERVAAKLVTHTRRRSPAYARSLALAALRETFEETGLALGVADLGAPPEPPAGAWTRFAATGVFPSLEGLDFLARAITPPGRTRRFDARFFVIDAAWIAHRVEGVVRDDAELTELVWVSLEDALRLEIPDITRAVLGDLAALGPGPWDPARPRPFYRMLRGRRVTQTL